MKAYAYVELRHRLHSFITLAPDGGERHKYINLILGVMPIPVAERSKAWVCSRSPNEIAGSNPAGGMDVCLL